MKKFITVFIALVFAVLPFVAIVKRQAIFDWWRLKDYSPSARVAELASNTTMTDGGRHLLYVYHAELQSSEDFNSSCDFSEQSIVLGCYVSGQGIYIFDVSDERLKGIHEVTAAHEVLHAAYERLSGKERSRIDALAEKTFKALNNQRITDTVEAYRKRDASIVPNELHSILGTEVEDLPAELEAHYSEYFKDRKVIVRYSEQYEKAFSERKTKVEQLLLQLDSLKIQIQSNEQSLGRTRAELEAEFASLEAQRSSAEPNSFNARVRNYNAKVRSYNVQVKESYSLIDQHNALVVEYNKVVLEEKELVEAIDSRPETIQQQ